MSPRNPNVPLVKSQYHIIDPTNSGCALDDGVEYWLHVCGRAADNTEHFGRCRLMLQSLAQFRIALLDLLEQAHVFDGNHSLVSKGPEKGNLFFGKRSNRRATDRNGPNGNTLTNKRDGQPRPNAQAMDGMPDVRPLRFALGPEIVNVNCLPIEYGPTTRGTTADWPGLADHKNGGNGPITCDFPLHVAFDAPDLSINSLAKSRCILRHHVQHRLNVRRGAGDNSLDFTRSSLLLQRLFQFLKQ